MFLDCPDILSDKMIDNNELVHIVIKQKRNRKLPQEQRSVLTKAYSRYVKKLHKRQAEVLKKKDQSKAQKYNSARPHGFRYRSAKEISELMIKNPVVLAKAKTYLSKKVRSRATNTFLQKMDSALALYCAKTGDVKIKYKLDILNP
ncbi:hypothetical protein pEaSNUABM12_00524 [Erwinia phage pEa_SNUABM_12]|uniref:Uncharacterized protein n=1 Tax=Erwinia phage pEa_SNUABM_12 TaxID=2768773 RepID=A0A7L8ZND8_9CAUD|nr:hypothetical protein pEaSNUABM12_00524 [Erwinia phage pEa_SNUABM_12]